MSLNIDQKLINAVKKNDIKAARKLLDLGAYPDTTDDLEMKWTALYYPLFFKNFGMAQLLISCGADVNISTVNNSGPLLCEFANEFETTKFLLDNGADPYQSNSIGCDVMWKAIEKNNFAVARLLLERQFKVGNNKESQTYLTNAIRNNNLAMANLLVENGCTLDKYLIRSRSGYQRLEDLIYQEFLKDYQKQQN